MRIITLTILTLILLGSKAYKGLGIAPKEGESFIPLQDNIGTASLTLDKVTYVFDQINWEKTRINYDGEDLRLTLNQTSLPKIRFRFPNIHESLEQQSEFTIPDVMRPRPTGGYFNSPITLSFQVFEEPKDKYPTQVVSFHKGRLKANLENGFLHIEFEGEGRKAMHKESDSFPVNGRITLKIE